MRLVYEDIETQIDFADSQINLLVIENPVLMREVVASLSNQINGETGKFVLSEGLKELSLCKSAAVVIDFFSMTLNERKVLTKLYDKLTEISISEDFYLKSNEIRSKIEEYTSDILFQSDLPLTHDVDFKIQDLFKLLNVRFENTSTSLLEKVVAYIELCTSFLGLKLVVFVNLNSYLQKEELEELYNQIKYYRIKLLLIEHSIARNSLPQEKLLVIDNDLCEI